MMADSEETPPASDLEMAVDVENVPPDPEITPSEQPGIKKLLNFHAKGEILNTAWSELFSFMTEYQAEMTLKEKLVENAQKELENREKRFDERKAMIEGEDGIVSTLEKTISIKEQALLKARSEMIMREELLKSMETELKRSKQINVKLNRTLARKISELLCCQGEVSRLKNQLKKVKEELESNTKESLSTRLNEVLRKQTVLLELETQPTPTVQTVCPLKKRKAKAGVQAEESDVIVDDGEDEKDTTSTDKMVQSGDEDVDIDHCDSQERSEGDRSPEFGVSRNSGRKRVKSIRLNPPKSVAVPTVPFSKRPRIGSLKKKRKVTQATKAQAKTVLETHSYSASSDPPTTLSDPSLLSRFCTSEVANKFPVTLKVMKLNRNAKEEEAAAAGTDDDGENVASTSQSAKGTPSKKGFAIIDPQAKRDSPRKHFLKKNYDVTELAKAVEDVSLGIRSIYSASKCYGIPRTTIWDKLQKKTREKDEEEGMGLPPRVLRREEYKIHEFIMNQQKKGGKITKTDIKAYAKKVAEEEETATFSKNHEFGEEWFKALVFRLQKIGMNII